MLVDWVCLPYIIYLSFSIFRRQFSASFHPIAPWSRIRMRWARYSINSAAPSKTISCLISSRQCVRAFRFTWVSPLTRVGMGSIGETVWLCRTMIQSWHWLTRLRNDTVAVTHSSDIYQSYNNTSSSLYHSRPAPRGCVGSMLQHLPFELICRLTLTELVHLSANYWPVDDAALVKCRHHSLHQPSHPGRRRARSRWWND